MDLKKLDTELNVKIIESLREILKEKNIKIVFDIPSEELLESSNVTLGNNNFKIFKKLVVEDIVDLNPKYKWLMSKKIIKDIIGMNHPQSINHIKEKTKYLFIFRPFLGKKIIKSELRTVVFRINYNNVIIELNKKQFERLNYYIKYVYKLQQLNKLNLILHINKTFNVVFDDDQIAKDMYNSMYDNLKDIIKPRDDDDDLDDYDDNLDDY